MLSVEGILQKATDDEEKAQQLVTVDKQVDLTYDLAHLAAFDPNPINVQALKSSEDQREDYLRALTRDNTQLLINKIWDLETKRVDNVITAVLPPPIYNLPRAKPIPKPKPPTKWELFAKSKGINKKKKERMVWDDVTQQWKPRYGYRSIGQQKNENQWMVEVPDQADPNKDYFAKESEEKNERVAKNELLRLRNLSRSQKLKLPGTSGILPNIDLKKDDLIQAKSLAKQSTASMGKFLKMESKDQTKDEKVPGIKRKFEQNVQKDFSEEKRKNIDLMEKVLAGQKRATEEDDEQMERKVTKTLNRMNSRMKKVAEERRAIRRDQRMDDKRKSSRKKNNNRESKKHQTSSTATTTTKPKPKKGGKSMKKYQNKIKNK